MKGDGIDSSSKSATGAHHLFNGFTESVTDVHHPFNGFTKWVRICSLDGKRGDEQ